MKLFKRMVSLALALVLACSALGGVQLPEAAAVETQSLAQLLNTKAIKPLGRTVATTNGILAVWSGCGFEMNVFAPADTTLTVGYTSSHDSYWAVLVDGEQVWRGLAKKGTGTFSATIPYGTHTVSVVKETEIDWSAIVSHVLTTMAFGGELLAAPENKDLYIEFIGDSYSAGDGALAEFVPGVAWSMVEYSATHGFPWYTAQALNADYSIVARGGIGLFDGTTGDTQQGANPTTTTMKDIYAYTSGFNKTNGEYSFARQPDIVVVELGANDSIKPEDATKTIATWQRQMAAFLTLVRAKNPKAAIVCIQHDASKYQVLRTLVESGDYGEAYAYFYAHHGNGSAAVATQKEGHPSADDHKEWAKNLANFLRYNDLVPTEAEKSYNDIIYYVAEGGNNSNDGSEPEKAVLTVPHALSLARANNTFADGDRVVIKVEGSVTGTTDQKFASATALKTTSGRYVPILITTNGYNAQEDNKAVLRIDFKPTADGAASCYSMNDIWFQNVELKSFTSNEGYAVYNFFACCQNLTFDNVEFTNDGNFNEKWNIGTTNFTSGNGVETAVTTEKHGTITFLNGDYTELGIVAAVFKESIYTTQKVYKELPCYHSKLVIGDGAKMGTVYAQYGVLRVGSTTVEINGGEVAKYVGTNSGTSTTRKTYNNGITLIINGGTIGELRGTGDFVNINGDVKTVMTGGKILVHSTGKTKNVCFGAGDQVTINGNVTNQVSGGEVLAYKDSTDDCEIVFGGRENTTINGILKNQISGGTFAVFNGSILTGSKMILLGCVESASTQLLRNEITGGTFYTQGGGIYFGGKGLKSVYKKIENVIGTKDQPSKAPRFLDKVYMGGNWGQIGATAYNGTAAGVPTACSDEVVLSNTIYGGYFANVLCGGVSSASNGTNLFEFIKGSVENNIYGGHFRSDFYGSSYQGNTFGKVTNNIYGGNFTGYFGASYSGKIHDGAETNVYGFTDLQVCGGSYDFQAGNANGGEVKATTEGRVATKVVFAPEKPEDITFYRNINTSTAVTGTKIVEIKGGTFPNGFKPGMAVENALADGSYCLINGAVVTPASNATTVSGAVTVKPVAAMIESAPYESLQAALKDAEGEEVVKLGADTVVETLSVNPSKTLDLNGKELTADNLLCFGDLVDNTDGEGGIVISNDPSNAVVHLQPGNTQLPIYDSENGCYRFFNYEAESLNNKTVTAGSVEKFGFRLELTNEAGYDLLANTEDSCMNVEVELKVGNRLTIPYVYTAEQVRTYATTAAEQAPDLQVAFVLTVKGLSALDADEVLTITPRVNTVSGKTVDLTAMSWSKAAQ